MLENYGWIAKNSGGGARATGVKQANPFGIRDVHGGVFEWCHDFHAADSYARSNSADPFGASAGFRRVLRGGAWNNEAVFCRSAFRNNTLPHYRDVNVGFRVIRLKPDVSPAARGGGIGAG